MTKTGKNLSGLFYLSAIMRDLGMRSAHAIIVTTVIGKTASTNRNRGKRSDGDAHYGKEKEMAFWNQIPPDKFDDMKPHEITARELQTQLVDLYDFLSIKSREILDTVNGDPYKLDSEGSYEFGRADGVCHLYFPRGYIGREPPHPAMASGKCFQWEPQEENEQLTIFDLEE